MFDRLLAISNELDRTFARRWLPERLFWRTRTGQARSALSALLTETQPGMYVSPPPATTKEPK